MINYDPKHWWRSFFAYAGTVLPAVKGRVAGLTLLTLALWGFSRWVWEIPAVNPLGHTLMGVVLGLLLVFRTNSSYDRFWEGRRLWGGLVNASRNLVRSGAAYCAPAHELAALVAAYVVAVKENLRGNQDLSVLAGTIPDHVLAAAGTAANAPSAVAFYISAWIHQRLRDLPMNGNLIRLMEMHLSTMVDCQGGCERILRTPIPFVYAIHLRHLMMAYLVTLPFVLVPIMQWCAIFGVAVITFSLLGIEEAGLEIEDPFGTDPNDLPLDDICAVIARDATMMAKLP
jgi:putative membrane protein